MFGRGKIRRRPMPSLCESGESEEPDWDEAAGDYVFRIVNNALTDREGIGLLFVVKIIASFFADFDVVIKFQQYVILYWSV